MSDKHMLRPGNLANFLDEMREETKSWESFVTMEEANEEFFKQCDFMMPVFLNSYALNFVNQNHGGWLLVSGVGTENENCGGDLSSLFKQIYEEHEEHELWADWNSRWEPYYSQIEGFDSAVLEAFIYLVAEQSFGALSLAGTKEDYAKLKPKEQSPELAAFMAQLKAKMTE